jgi:hypothetical protein
MRMLAGILVAAGLAWSMPALAQGNDASPLVGRWALEVERLEMPGHMRPKSVTYSFSVAPDGKWVIDVEIVTTEGTMVRGASIAPLNGVPAGVDSPVVDVAAMTRPEPGVLVMALSNRGAPVGTRIYTASKDGETMTETGTSFSPQGMPSVQTSYFHRVR